MVFFQTIGAILFFSGVSSSIVMNAVVGESADLSLIQHHRWFVSAITNALTLPGMWVGIGATIAKLVLNRTNPLKNIWALAIITLSAAIIVNGIVFLTPLVEQVTNLANSGMEHGGVFEIYQTMKAKEDMFGAANFMMAVMLFFISFFGLNSRKK